MNTRPKLAFLAILSLMSVSAVAGPAFTGDAAVDFTAPEAVFVPDPGGIDVGVPASAPGGTVSGWDMSGDPVEDALYVGYDVPGVFGDADGDGDAGATAVWLAGLSGTDYANLADTEAATLVLDTNNDGSGDVIVGAGSGFDLTGFGVYYFSGSMFAPGVAFGSFIAPATIHASPSAAQPDFEFRIADFSTLPGVDPSGCAGGFGIGVNVFAGSYSDGGIGEDFVPGAGTFAWVVVPGCPVSAEAASFGELKAMFR